MFRTFLVCCLVALALCSPITPLMAKEKHMHPTPHGDPSAYTYTIVDLPAPTVTPPRLLALNGITNTGSLSGFFSMDQGYGARVAPDLTLTPVMCPPSADFQRYPFAANAGPQVVGMNNDQVIVANDEGLTALHGLTQPLRGPCTYFLVPDSVGTWATGINDLGHVVGFSWNAADLPDEPGLLRFHGFFRDAGGVVQLDGPGPHDVVFPTGINVLGQIIGYLYSDVQPDNSYVYHAFVYDQDLGIYTILDDPSGEDVWLRGINNRGQIVGVVGNDGVTGGTAFLFDEGEFMTLPMPSATTTVLAPTAINDLGQFVGMSQEPDPNGPHRIVFHQVLATPVPQGKTPPAPRRLRLGGGTPGKNTVRTQMALAAAKGTHTAQFQAEVDAVGAVVLRNATRVLGAKQH